MVLQVMSAKRMELPTKNFYRQLYLAGVASLGYLVAGLMRGWPAAAIPSLQDDKPTLLVTEEEESWVSAVPLLGAFIGSIAAWPLLHKFGRKRTLLLSAPLFAVGWLLIGLSPSFPTLLCARILTGLCAGLVIPAAQVYVCECSHPSIRGLLGSLPALGMTIGVLISYMLGIWLSWHQMALVSTALPVILSVLLLPLPESPAWLASRGDQSAAEKAMRWLDENFTAGSSVYDGRRRPMEAYNKKRRLSSSDMANLSARKSSINIENLRFNFVIEEKPMKEQHQTNPDSYFQSGVLRPFLLSVALLIFQVLSGFDVVLSYSVEIFEAAESSIEGHLATLTVGVVQVVATAATLFLIDKLGRKPLLIASSLLMAVSMGALAVYFFHERRGEAENMGVVPLVALLVFTTGYSVGFGSVPFVLMGEIFPESHRSGLSAVAGSATLGMMFAVIKTYDGLRDRIRNEGVFGLYAAFCLMASFFVCALVPETKGRTLQEIEEYFKGPKSQKHISDDPDPNLPTHHRY